jgi:uncharacterized membrane protein
MKREFLTGLAILLPIVVTLIILAFVVNLLTAPFLGMVEGILTHFDLLDSKFLFLSGQQVLEISSKVIILVVLIALTILLGAVARIFFIRYLLQSTDVLFHKIPVLNKIYMAIQEVLKTLLKSKKSNFSQVVLVPFPHERALSLGLLTGKLSLQDSKTAKMQDYASVFVPGTLNPTMGFIVLYRPEQLIYIDMKVDEAFKFIVSCGLMLPDFSKQEPLKP